MAQLWIRRPAAVLAIIILLFCNCFYLAAALTSHIVPLGGLFFTPNYTFGDSYSGSTPAALDI